MLTLKNKYRTFNEKHILIVVKFSFLKISTAMAKRRSNGALAVRCLLLLVCCGQVSTSLFFLFTEIQTMWRQMTLMNGLGLGFVLV